MNTSTHIKIIDLHFVKPFADNKSVGIYKRRTLKHFTKCAGCYMIKEDEQIVYVGMSQSCVVEAMYRHFYEWNDRRGNHYRTTYFKKLEKKNYTVTIIATAAAEAPKFEQSLIMLLNPRDNKEMYENIIPRMLEQYGYSKNENNNRPAWVAINEGGF